LPQGTAPHCGDGPRHHDRGFALELVATLGPARGPGGEAGKTEGDCGVSLLVAAAAFAPTGVEATTSPTTRKPDLLVSFLDFDLCHLRQLLNNVVNRLDELVGLELHGTSGGAPCKIGS